jgi:hypothetical protein
VSGADRLSAVAAIAGALAALAALLGSFVTALLARRSAQRNRRSAQALAGSDLEAGVELLELPIGEQPGTSFLELREWLTRAYAAERDAPESVKKELHEIREAFQERLERIEQRFPEEATLEKIASINDAILATKIEQLEKSVEELGNRILSKWDVATIVFAVIASVGVVAGAIFAVANFVTK